MYEGNLVWLTDWFQMAEIGYGECVETRHSTVNTISLKFVKKEYSLLPTLLKQMYGTSPDDILKYKKGKLVQL